jgi:hypothetical protein
MEINMRNLIWSLPLAFIVGCGDKDEDTGDGAGEEVIEDTAGEDTAGGEDT